MDGDQYNTPQKFFSKQSPSLKFLSSSCTPKTRLKCIETSPSSISRKTPGAFHLFPFVNTPPTRLPKVINPFEQALTERLHLPLICSPSLFQSRNTTEHSSGHFEWTIDEVSSLKPANVEPHEAQFQSSVDPDFEAKAQAAISSYFKEQQIVPSPIDCAIRKQKIQLPEITGETPIAKPGRRIRDGIAQTILTFPPHLPEEFEAIIKKFCTYHEPQQQSPTIDCDTTIDYEARDASLRRKLFGASDNELSCEVEMKMLMKYDFSPPPKSPDLNAEKMQTKKFENSPSKNSFGSLSPISKLDSPEPNCNTDKTKNPINGSPKFSSTNYQMSSDSCKYHKTTEKTSEFETTSKNSPIQSLYRSTPDGSFKTEPNSPNNMSVDMSSSIRSNRILFNSSLKAHSNNIIKSRSFSELDMFETSYNFEDDDMQMSQLSGKSTSSSNGSQHSDTPRRKRKSASRRNLSQSFTSYSIDTDDQIASAGTDNAKQHPLQTKKTEPDTMKTIEQSIFYRTDSGFNELTQTQDDVKFNELRLKEIIVETIETKPLNYSLKDISMISCSTPSKFPEF